MTARRPSKPWRVTLTTESEHASTASAYTRARTALSGGASPATVACIEEWEDGRWHHYETLRPEDIQVEETQ